MPHALKLTRTSRLLKLALLLCVLFAGVVDQGHQHDDVSADPQCYACHFSPETAVAAESASLVQLAPARAIISAGRVQPALAPKFRAYDAQGPPLLI